MAYLNSSIIISDPDLLFYYAGASGSAPGSANLIVDYTAKTIQLNPAATGASSLAVSGGATLKCVYSKMKEIWKNDSTLIKFPFPMLPITDEQFELINGWNFANIQTKQLIRTGGWAVKNLQSNTTEEYACVISLGSLASLTDQIYYCQTAMTSITVTGSTTNFALTGPVNQAIQTYASSAGSGTPQYDYRGYLKLFCREYGKTYANSTLSDIGVTTLTYQAYRFPVTTTTDLKIVNSNPTTGAYANMSLTWNSSPVSYTATNAANYNVSIEASGGTAQQVYEFIQYKLRRGNTADIDANATAGYVKNGEIAPDLLRFVGDTLYTIYQSVGPTGGVWVNNIGATDKNSIYFYDNTNTQQYYPYQSVLRINFGDNLVNDTSSKFTVFFTAVPSGSYGTTSAYIVNDASSAAMSYAVTAVPSYSTNKYVDLTFDYDGNTQGGRTAGADAPITVVALGLSTSQYVTTTGTIGRSKSNSVSLVSSLERNYLNP